MATGKRTAAASISDRKAWQPGKGMSSPTPAKQRPLSPFMIGPYYRPQLTSMLSIAHRATGVLLAFGAFALAPVLDCE